MSVTSSKTPDSFAWMAELSSVSAAVSCIRFRWLTARYAFHAMKASSAGTPICIAAFRIIWFYRPSRDVENTLSRDSTGFANLLRNLDRCLAAVDLPFCSHHRTGSQSEKQGVLLLVEV